MEFNEMDVNGKTGFIWACFNGYADLVEVLLKGETLLKINCMHSASYSFLGNFYTFK